MLGDVECTIITLQVLAMSTISLLTVSISVLYARDKESQSVIMLIC